MYQLVPENRVEFGRVLSESLTLFWRHRSLWIASLIAGLLGQNRSGGTSVGYQQSRPFPQTQPGAMPDFQGMIAGTWFEDVIRNPVPYLVIGGAVLLVWWLITLFLGSWAAGSLICMVDEIDRDGSTSVGSGWRQARPRLGALIVLRLLVVLPILLSGAVAMVTLLPFWLRMMRIVTLPPEQIEQAMQTQFSTMFGGIFCVIPLLVCVGAPITLALSAISVFAERACMLEGMGAIASLRRGWQVLRVQIGYSILAWVLLMFVGIVVGVLLLLPIMPFLWRTMSNVFSEGFSTNLSGDAILIFGYSIIASLTLGSLVSGWTSVFWTKLYKSFTNLR